MKIEINKLTSDKTSVEFLKAVADKTAKLLKLKIPELSVALACDRRIKALNKKYRKKDRITDVLAFDYGEIIICLPQAKRQAKELGHSIKKELSILLIHGLLHLTGYNDETKQEYDIMKREGDNILNKIKDKK